MAWRADVKKRLYKRVAAKEESTEDEDVMVVDEQSNSMTRIHSTTSLPPAKLPQSLRLIAAMRRTGDKELVDRTLMPPPIKTSLKRKRHVPADDTLWTAKSVYNNDFFITWIVMGMSPPNCDDIGMLLDAQMAEAPTRAYPLLDESPSKGHVVKPGDVVMSWAISIDYKERLAHLSADESLDALGEIEEWLPKRRRFSL